MSKTPNNCDTQAERKLFRYGLRMRPYCLGTTPKDVTEHLSAEQIDVTGVEELRLEYFTPSDYRHGIVKYNRQLTDSEIKSFELVDLNVSTKDLFNKFVEFAKECKEYNVTTDDFIADYIHPKSAYQNENPLNYLGFNKLVEIISKHFKTDGLRIERVKAFYASI